ncbi:MAG: CHASE2 domain-containing protein [Chitinispirillia bacterium]|nr:CHASE2 domain-containing protein [Chitinispirillia bacterium]MCL2242342.1 CHASE2 domain-containing protein [Chitinispirillia bacterium]
MTKSIKKFSTILALSLLFSAGATLLLQYAGVQLTTRIEGTTYDWRYRIKYPDAMDGVEFPGYGIHIVDIDERSMEKMGVYWGWDRGIQAKMVDSLSSHFPAAIAFDVLFFDREDETRYNRLAKVLSDAVAGDAVLSENSDMLYGRLKSAVNYDIQFADAIRRSGRVTLGIALYDTSDYHDYTSQIAHRMNMEWHNSLNPASAVDMPDSLLRHIYHTKTIINGIYPENAQAARQLGHVNVIDIDNSSVTRQIPLLYKLEKIKPMYLPMSIRVAATLYGTPNGEIAFVPDKHIDIGKPFKIFKDTSGAVRFSYPDFSETQLRMIMANSGQIASAGSGPQTMITSYTALFRDDAGRPCLKTRGGMFPHDLTAIIKEMLSLEDKGGIGNMAAGGEKEIGSGYTVRRDSEDEWEIFSGDEQIWLRALDIKTISALTPDDFELNPETARKLLTFDFWVKREGGILVSSLPVLRAQTLEELLAAGPQVLESIEPGTRRDFGKSARIPLGRDNSHIVTYFGPKSKPFPYFPFYDIMENNIKFSMEGNVFIVGSTSPAMLDIKAAPHDREFPAVEIHASIINSILTDTYVHRLTDWQNIAILLTVGFTAALMAFLMKPFLGGIFAAAWLAAYTLAAIHVFDNSLIWIEMVRPIITIALAFTGVMVYRYMTEEKNRKFLQDTFKQYLSPELIDKMYYEKQSPKLGGDAGVRTAFFTDIAGFSTFSEQLGSPTRLVELLNEYLTGMTDILLSHYGTLDKYEGDAIIAFFGAPALIPNHAAKACQTAIDMQQKLSDFRQKWATEKCDRKCAERKCGDKCGEKEKWPQIVHNMQMRIGINTGEMITGNMGSAVRMNYTMMGDSVNLAARLEGAAKQYGISTMISSFTYDIVKDEFETRKLGCIRVVGKSEAVAVYELISKKGELPDEMKELLPVYNQGIDCYYARDWQKALACFTKADALEPNRKNGPEKPTPSARFVKSCEEYIKNPPGEEWDGVDELKSK